MFFSDINEINCSILLFLNFLIFLITYNFFILSTDRKPIVPLVKVSIIFKPIAELKKSHIYDEVILSLSFTTKYLSDFNFSKSIQTLVVPDGIFGKKHNYHLIFLYHVCFVKLRGKYQI